MARINNLSNFLTDVANALRLRKGTEAPISAANFDTEIINIPTASIQELKVAIPTTSVQTIRPDTGYDAIAEVSVAAVTSAIDANIVASNIKSGVTILGVTGTFEGAGDVMLYATVQEMMADTSNPEGTLGLVFDNSNETAVFGGIYQYATRVGFAEATWNRYTEIDLTTLEYNTAVDTADDILGNETV